MRGASEVQLLDTTLRDGSYVVGFQLTAQDTAVIAATLDANGVPFIEVGHGLGMNAGANPRMRAACSDEDYLRAAAGVVQRGRWGMFFIPGIGRMRDLDLAASWGMGFVRIGTNVTEVETAAPFIAHARRLGMFVSANFMKTYAEPPARVGALARQAADYGADIVCIVDSAGGMFPEDVAAYFEAARAETEVPLGFHGHNNLGLAIANTLRAVELGAAVVDTSIRGMGRSAGNASTEILLLALRRRGIELGIDPLRIMTIAERWIDPMVRSSPQVDSIGIVSGYAQFHSSFLGTVLEHAGRFGVDPRELILRVAREDKVNAPPELVERLARELADRPEVPRHLSVRPPAVERGEAETPAASAARVAADARTVARKLGKTAVFNLVQASRPGAGTCISATIVDGPSFVTASAEIASAVDAEAVAKAVDGIVAAILLDCDAKSSLSRAIVEAVRRAAAGTRILPYGDTDAWARSVVGLALELGGGVPGSVALVGATPLAEECARRFRQLGAACRLLPPDKWAPDAVARADVIVVCEPLRAESPVLERVFGSAGNIVIDALIGALPEDALGRSFGAGRPVFRPDMRAVIHGEISAALGTAALVEGSLGTAEIAGVRVAAGGRVAPRGTVIVDSARAPTRVLGIADGRGFLLPAGDLGEEMRARLDAVQAELFTVVAG